jgi:DNA-directed RNA polymerase I subunit RPA43
MAVDAMDIDALPLRTAEAERKRKSKTTASSPTKKRKQAATATATAAAPVTPESPFSLKKATLYLPLSPISISPTHALASLLAEHLSPLLLTYYPPLKGVVMAYSNASISSKPPSPTSTPSENPQPLTLARTADEYGVLYVYLTATFLVFKPERGQILDGWVNVQSDGFLGAVVFNLFSVGIERKRLPSNWKWVPPGEEAEATATDEDSASDKDMADFDAEKEGFQPAALDEEEMPLEGEEEESAHSGYFQSVSGHRVRGSVRFRVVDVDVIPGSERDRGFLSIEGPMLGDEEEARLSEAERQGQSLPHSYFDEPVNASIPVAVSAVEAVEEPETVDVHVESPKKEKKVKKEKKDKSEKKEKKSKSSKKKE